MEEYVCELCNKITSIKNPVTYAQILIIVNCLINVSRTGCVKNVEMRELKMFKI